MASPKISVRLVGDTYRNLLRLAQLERKTITELVRELIDQGLSARDRQRQQTDAGAILQGLDALEGRIGELIAEAVKAGASARFLRLAVAFGIDTVSWLTDHRLADDQSKAQFLAQMEALAEQYAREYLTQDE